ncbi:MAG: TonB-dependent receptor [Flavobacteriaceae bacterium]|nr:TonB-dependent receptor [Flavobacteriaceae bacterium]
MVKDNNSNPISYANIVVLKSIDSSLVTGTISDDNGSFNIENLPPDNYTLRSSFLGFKTQNDSITLNENIVLSLILSEEKEILGEVNILVKKPTITRKPDRLLFNVENTALTEGSTLKVLKNTPGIIVSEGSINIKSTSATVFINNRRVQLTSDELIELLESTPANSIKTVEVITNPPASYDADSGKVINIIMSKNLVSGYRGTVAANFTQGVFPRFNGTTSHYFKKNKFNLNLNYSYNNQKINREEENEVDYLNNRYIIEQIWNSMIGRNTWSETHNVNLNFDYFLSEKTTLSLTSTSLFTPYFKYKIYNNTRINDANSNFLSRFTTDNLSLDDRLNIGTDLTLITQFDNGGSLSFNGHYTVYIYNRDQNAFSQFFDSINSFTNSSEFNTFANQDTDIYTAKADYSLPINETSSLDVGVKFANIKTKSDITRLDIINGSQEINTENSNAFDYDENIFAAYVNYSKSWDKWELVLGLRSEQTNVDGFSPTLNQTSTQDYFRWFPNASVSNKISDNLSLYINYKRSITRPLYTSLNPFTFFLNENTIVIGNPALKPTFQDHFVAGTSFLKYFTIEAYYINYDGAISEIPRQDNNSNILAYTPINLDKTVDFGFDFALDFNPTTKWNLYFVTSFFNISEENEFGTDKIELDQWSNYSILANNISFLKDNSLNLNLTLTWVGKNLQGLQIVDDRLVSELSITKSIFKNRGILSLSIEDVFNEQDYRTKIRYLNQSSRQFMNIDNRFVKLGFRYKFGNTKLDTNEHTTELEERDRIKDLQ